MPTTKRQIILTASTPKGGNGVSSVPGIHKAVLGNHAGFGLNEREAIGDLVMRAGAFRNVEILVPVKS